jgi:hypothetical protein
MAISVSLARKVQQKTTRRALCAMFKKGAHRLTHVATPGMRVAASRA